MTRPGTVAKPATLRTQLGRQVPVIAHLEQQHQHRGVQNTIGHRVPVELAHRGQDVVDPTRATDPALPGARPSDRRRLEHRDEHPKRRGSGQKIPPAGLTPPQVARQVAGIGAGRALGPAGPQAQVTQVGVGDRDRHPVLVDHSPVAERVGQLDPQRLHEDLRCRCAAQIPIWRTVA